MEERQIFAPKPKVGEAWDVAIIGSGPASLTAAIYTTRGAVSTLILGGEKWGGQLMLTTEVDNYPALPGIQGPELMQKMREHATRFGGEFIEKNVETVDFDPPAGGPFELTAGGQKYLARSVIIASGADTKWLDVPGEDKLRGRGVSSCAPCDAPFFKGKKVIVVGGGDSAIEEAIVLTKYATSITMIHRRDEFKASKAMQQKIFDKAKAGQVKIIWDSQVTEILGEQVIASVRLKTKADTKQSQELKGGKLVEFQGKIVEEKEGFIFWEMPIEGLFVAIGHVPSTKIFAGPIELDKKGYIVVNNHTKTNIVGVYVAGDVHDYHYRQAVTAAGFGCMAAMDVLKYLEEVKV